MSFGIIMFLSKYFETLPAITDKNILPSTFRRQIGLSYVIAVKFLARFHALPMHYCFHTDVII